MSLMPKQYCQFCGTPYYISDKKCRSCGRTRPFLGSVKSNG